MKRFLWITVVLAGCLSSFISNPAEHCRTDDDSNGQVCILPSGSSFGRCGGCGDGIQSGDEKCDDGNDINTDSCTNECKAAACGDGLVSTDIGLGQEGYEACDDGNSVDTDACTNGCAAAACGDSIFRAGLEPDQAGYEACDDGNQANDDDCSEACQPHRCGDNIVRTDLQPGEEGFEECDDGNADNGDGCLNDCVLARCGDGTLRRDLAEGQEGYEACDDGNLEPGDDCLPRPNGRSSRPIVQRRPIHGVKDCPNASERRAPPLAETAQVRGCPVPTRWVSRAAPGPTPRAFAASSVCPRI